MAVFILSSFWGMCNVCFGFARSSSVMRLGKRFSNLTHPRISSQLFFSFVVVVLLYVCVSCLCWQHWKYKFRTLFWLIFPPLSLTLKHFLIPHKSTLTWSAFWSIRSFFPSPNEPMRCLCAVIFESDGAWCHTTDAMTQQFIKGQLDCDIHTMNYRRAKINHPLLCEPFTSASGC